MRVENGSRYSLNYKFSNKYPWGSAKAHKPNCCSSESYKEKCTSSGGNFTLLEGSSEHLVRRMEEHSNANTGNQRIDDFSGNSRALVEEVQ